MFSRVYRLQTQLWVPQKRQDIFEFYSDAFKLESLTPPWLHFEVLTLPPIEMRRGKCIDYRLRLHGLPIRWRTEITDWHPPVRFEDSQVRGPYALWIHTHTFEESEGGTLVRDEVRYSVPGGPLLHAIAVKPDLRRIFTYRHEQLPGLLGLEAAQCTRGEIVFSRDRPERMGS
ncbi:MAG: SRPBCC family protein [Planctomycetaceae bacterium]